MTKERGAPVIRGEIHVTTHALYRWRQRSATYANATIADVEQAVRESFESGLQYPLPSGLHARKGSRYFYHPPTGTWFAANGREFGHIDICTCLVTDMNGSMSNASRFTKPQYEVWQRTTKERKQRDEPEWSVWVRPNGTWRLMAQNLLHGQAESQARKAKRLMGLEEDRCLVLQADEQPEGVCHHVVG